MKLKGQTAIVTGAANGIGAQTALLLSQQGANVVLVDSASCAGTLQAIQSFRDKAIYLECLGEVRDKEFVNAAIARASDTFGELHILVNNMCICGIHNENQSSIDQWQLEADLKAQATSLFIQGVSPYMVEQKYGRIINISSISSCDKERTFTASRRSISKLTKQTAKELCEYGITCNSITPIAMTNFDETKIHQTGTEVSIAEAVLYFASSESSYTTGQILKVDGGFCIESPN
ncbi:SDR family NAD(P)-dependent oxidoreductase [Sporosarcina sp. P29]|uniref:SDR family NAD(P)-dependent oxidoreductase n=1 Tax=Sporosarcina sp. P29 TaxID=2048252 RepID=UPI000C1680E5|nr:SDR family oxidoreductase [Sporosarcina sp. P29]PIC99455.1 3-oxoacyl-ACP reductase [Sporosarcina sp. P29]